MLLSVLTFGNNAFFPTFPNKISFLYWPTSKQVASFSVSSSDVGACKYKHIQIQMQDNTNTRKYKYKYKHIQIQIQAYTNTNTNTNTNTKMCHLQCSSKNCIDRAVDCKKVNSRQGRLLQMMMLYPFWLSQ